MKHSSIVSVASAIAIVLSACATAPTRYPEIETARNTIHQVEELPLAGEVGAQELEVARASLRDAESLAQRHRSTAEISNAAYLAQRHAQIAEQQVALASAQRSVEDAQRERTAIVAQARAHQAELQARAAQDRAEDRAQNATLSAQEAERDAQARTQEAEQRAQQATLTAQEAEQRAQQAEQSKREVQMRLQRELADLKPKVTDRGTVLTLGDVLFDTGKATLKPGAVSRIDRLANYLKQSPDHNVTIEGHTDSTGTAEFNQELSQERADTVRQALVNRGVSPEHIHAVGKGEDYPIASNNSPGGRQQNRRVEVVIS